MEVLQILQEAIRRGASDIFVVPGVPVTYKVSGAQQRAAETGRLTPVDTGSLVQGIYQVCGRRADKIADALADDDFSFAVRDLGRFRVNVMHQRGSLAAVIRVIRFGIPCAEELHIPPEVMRLTEQKKGMVLVTGSAGSGKSTTLACLIDAINHTRDGHIITMEDPIEYVHRHDRCIVTQREVFTDSPSYISALRSALRESPDVILLGEMRDYETIETAITAAETGELLFSTLHTTGAASSVDRIIDTFPAEQQAQVRIQLSMVLRAVVSQQLVPTVDDTLYPVFEIMLVNPAIRNLIRESKTYQIDGAILSGAAEGMCTMENSLLALYRAQRITAETALTYSLNYDSMKRKLAMA
jgi:twitching motility protein PilT